METNTHYWVNSIDSQDGPSQKPKNSAVTDEKKTTQAFTILLVDDETDLRDVIAFDLKRKGYEVTTASGGQEAWEKLKTLKSIDLVITDIKMPQGDGLELLKNIVAHQPHLPVICLTGFAELSPEEILKLGAKAIFEKPFDRKKFHELLLELKTTAEKT